MKAEEFVTALKQKPKCVNSEAMFTDQMRVAFPMSRMSADFWSPYIGWALCLP